MFYIKYIAYTCYPPRSETSHDGGLVDLHYKSCALIIIVRVDCHFFQGDTFKKTEGSQDVLHTWMSLQGCRGSA